VFRAIGFAREDAFRWWNMAGFAANFAAAHHALVRLGYSRLAAALGAFLFAFGLPVTAQEDHAQLVYRFGVPLAVLALEQFATRLLLRQLALCAFWTTWQFYCSIYTGYFLVLLLLALMLGHALCHMGRPIAGIRSLAVGARTLWMRPTARAKAGFLLTMTVLAALIVLLGQPYYDVGRFYGFRRSWPEIAFMLPRPESYPLTTHPGSGQAMVCCSIRCRCDMSTPCSSVSLLTICLAAILRLARRASVDRYFVPTALAIVLLVLLTLWVNSHSFYRVIYWLPGVNAIRAVTRIIIILLFPCGILLAGSVDAIRNARLPGWTRSATIALIAALLVAENATITHFVATRHDWQARMTQIAAELPQTIPPAPILLLAPERGDKPSWPRQLDAMLFAQDHGWPTMNGYSGNVPAGYPIPGLCEYVALALTRALVFRGRYSEQNYADLASHVMRVGYPPCGDASPPRDPHMTTFTGPVSVELMANVALRIDSLQVRDGRVVVAASVVNGSSITLAAISTSATPIRLSARFTDALAPPTDLKDGPGWDSRKDIVFDILPGASQRIEIGIDPPARPGRYRVAVSMVQDGGVVPQSRHEHPVSIDRYCEPGAWARAR
jgi:hypothetical protein